ncbi:hypothetical protein DES53_106350 [Roseimicrobium gellanilyticum]|uniref:Uncharacterized protein n=1 Tax=Roseimicrobium gellanilyticum TaxID=748857 RepID=A0A366HIV0_9BACT|nr:hypothetical protein [Roseimicrobium gellanilyticum]RBP42641.1 hypothetical protein DES53_106350 [Roseimicrobium gellanilyticum]
MKTRSLQATAIMMALMASLSTSPLPAKDELPPGVTRVTVVFSGGHDTVPVDHGRPVVLIAAALGVPDEVFREAFSHVRPAAGGREPEPQQVRANKSALMSALGKHGVTNDRLDEVSNFYRYPPGRGGLWRNKPATAHALVKEGTVIGFEVVDGGSGYSSPPSITVPGVKTSEVKVTLSYGKDLQKNGSVSTIAMTGAKVK